MILMQKHKILSFLLSFVAAMALWVYAVTVINPDDVTSIRGVRVRLVGTNELQMSHLILTGGEEQVVDVEIAGRRSDLKELNSSTLEVVADVSKIDGP
jgi:YbbR domain-containing protein